MVQIEEEFIFNVILNCEVLVYSVCKEIFHDHIYIIYKQESTYSFLLPCGAFSGFNKIRIVLCAQDAISGYMINIFMYIS